MKTLRLVPFFVGAVFLPHSCSRAEVHAWVIGRLIQGAAIADIEHTMGRWELERELRSACDIQLRRQMIPDLCFEWLSLTSAAGMVTQVVTHRLAARWESLCRRSALQQRVGAKLKLALLPPSCREPAERAMQRQRILSRARVGPEIETVEGDDINLDP